MQKNTIVITDLSMDAQGNIKISGVDVNNPIKEEEKKKEKTKE